MKRLRCRPSSEGDGRCEFTSTEIQILPDVVRVVTYQFKWPLLSSVADSNDNRSVYFTMPAQDVLSCNRKQ